MARAVVTKIKEPWLNMGDRQITIGYEITCNGITIVRCSAIEAAGTAEFLEMCVEYALKTNCSNEQAEEIAKSTLNHFDEMRAIALAAAPGATH